MAAHALECLGTRGPESMVGLPERASPALLFPNSLRSTIPSFLRGKSLTQSPRRLYQLRAGVAECEAGVPAEGLSVDAAGAVTKSTLPEKFAFSSIESLAA